MGLDAQAVRTVGDGGRERAGGHVRRLSDRMDGSTTTGAHVFSLRRGVMLSSG